MDISKIRLDSPVCANYAYFDTAAASAATQKNIDAVTEYLQRTAEAGLYLPSFRKETYARIEQVREQAAAFINAKPEEIAFIKNATEGLCFIAQGMAWQPGDEVIIPDFENLSNLVPWLRLEQTRGIKVIKVPAQDSGKVAVADIEAVITERTRLISFSHLPNATGAIQDAKAICAMARKHGVQTLICAAQSLGMIPTDVREIDCDYLAACGRKALRAIEGTGILYVRQSLIGSLEPCLVGWWNSSFDFKTQQLSLAETARRFEAGCPNVPAILSLGEAVAYAQELGIEAIFERVRALGNFALERLQRLPGFELYGPQDAAGRIGIIPFNIKGVNAQALVRKMEERNIIIEAGHFMAHTIMNRYQITEMLRLSLHYFNSEQEIEDAIAVIRDTMQLQEK
ncbi:aminotransferase class V-fold PLP-dependent enzyme [Zobellella aerophila]|uniref:Cysteine desulfurase n=1 Tax=Zobellella aerophila TaxID=870480 RepID=A0ABP6WA32_9GAMM